MPLDLIGTPDPEPPTDPIPQLVQVSLVCRTEGCENEGEPITMSIPESTSFAFCGPCGERITEYTELEEQNP